MNVSTKIYEIIDEKSLKQSAVATKAGYSPRIFNDFLKGRRTIKTDDIVPICKALGITPNELFSIE